MNKHFKKILYFLLLCINIIFTNTPDNIFYKQDNTNFYKSRNSTSCGDNIAGQYIKTMKLFDIYKKTYVVNLLLLDNKIIFYSNNANPFSALNIIEYEIDDNYTYNVRPLVGNTSYTYTVTKVESEKDNRFKNGVYKHEIEITKAIYRNTVTIYMELDEFFVLFDLTETKYSSIFDVINIIYYITNLMKYTFLSDESIKVSMKYQPKKEEEKEKIIEILNDYKKHVEQPIDRKEFATFQKEKLNFPTGIKKTLNKEPYSKEEETRFTNSLEDLHKSLLEDLEKFIIYYKFKEIGVNSNLEIKCPKFHFNDLGDSDDTVQIVIDNQLKSKSNINNDTHDKILQKLFDVDDTGFNNIIDAAINKCQNNEYDFSTNPNKIFTIIELLKDLKNTDDDNIKQLSLLYLMIFKSSPQIYINRDEEKITGILQSLIKRHSENHEHSENHKIISDKCKKLLYYLTAEPYNDKEEFNALFEKMDKSQEKLLNFILSETYKILYDTGKYFYEELSRQDLNNIVNLHNTLRNIDSFDMIGNKLKYLILYHQEFLNKTDNDAIISQTSGEEKNIHQEFLSKADNGEISQISGGKNIYIDRYENRDILIKETVNRLANNEFLFSVLLKQDDYNKERLMIQEASKNKERAEKFENFTEKHDKSDIAKALDAFHQNNTESINDINSYYSDSNITHVQERLSNQDKRPVQLFSILLNFLDYIIQYLIILIFVGSMIMLFLKFITSYNDDDWRKVHLVVGELFFKLLISSIILNNIKVIYILSGWITDSSLYLFSYINTGVIQSVKYPNLLINILSSTSMMERYKMILMIDGPLFTALLKLFLIMLCITILIGYYFQLLKSMINFLFNYISVIFLTPILLSIYFLYSGSQNMLLQVIKKLFISIVFISFAILIYNLTEQIIIDVILSILGDSVTYGEYNETDNAFLRALKAIWYTIQNVWSMWFYTIAQTWDFFFPPSPPSLTPTENIIKTILCILAVFILSIFFTLYYLIVLILQIIFTILFVCANQASQMYREPYLFQDVLHIDLITILTMYFLLSEITTSLNFIISYYFDESPIADITDSFKDTIKSGTEMIKNIYQANEYIKDQKESITGSIGKMRAYIKGTKKKSIDEDESGKRTWNEYLDRFGPDGDDNEKMIKNMNEYIKDTEKSITRIIRKTRNNSSPEKDERENHNEFSKKQDNNDPNSANLNSENKNNNIDSTKQNNNNDPNSENKNNNNGENRKNDNKSSNSENNQNNNDITRNIE